MSPEEDELQDVLATLAPLAPHPAERPRPAALALTDLRQRLETRPTMNRRFNDMSRRKYALATLAVVLVVVALFTIPGVRAAANDFLGLFRVQKFAAVSVSPQQLALLEELAESGLYPGEIQLIGEPGEPTVVDSVEAAEAATGLDVRLPADAGRPSTVQVTDGGSGRLIVNVAAARALAEAAGADPQLIPDSLEGQAITATLFPSVTSEYRRFGSYPGGVSLMQMPSPEIAYPPGVDAREIGRALLQLLGMKPRQAARLADSLDWTSTLLLPIPEDVASFQEVEVDGVPGLLLTSLDGQHAALLWQKDGMVYFVVGANGAQVVAVADRLE
jgi:hypothetical protein